MVWLYQDAFNRANETPLAGQWVTSPSLGAFNLASNVVQAASFAADSGAQLVATVLSWPNDQWCRSIVTATGTVGGASGVGLRLRSDAVANTFYRATMDHAAASNVNIGKVIAGTYTSLGTATLAWSDGAMMEFQVQGQTVSLLVNGTRILTANDTAIAAGTPGVFYSSTITAATNDQFEAGDFLQQIGGLPTAQPPNPPRVGATAVQ